MKDLTIEEEDVEKDMPVEKKSAELHGASSGMFVGKDVGITCNVVNLCVFTRDKVIGFVHLLSVSLLALLHMLGLKRYMFIAMSTHGPCVL